jgi:hypothetical protein
MNRVYTGILSLLVTACYSNPKSNIGAGIVGLLLGYGGWKILISPAKTGSPLFAKVAYGMLAISLLLLLA